MLKISSCSSCVQIKTKRNEKRNNQAVQKRAYHLVLLQTADSIQMMAQGECTHVLLLPLFLL